MPHKSMLLSAPSSTSSSRLCGSGVPGLSCCLMAVIDYRGFRVAAVAVQPFDFGDGEVGGTAGQAGG